MLSRYLDSLQEIFGEEKKEKIIQRLLLETERFLLANLETKMGRQFELDLDLATEEDDAEKEMSVLVRYLMQVPDVKYRLDCWMNEVIAEIKYQVLKKRQGGNINGKFL